MAHILCVYATGEGQTAKIANRLADQWRDHGHTVLVADAEHEPPTAQDVADADLVVVGDSIHVGGFHRKVVKWVKQHLEALKAKPGALFVVCLGVLSEDPAEQEEVNHFPAKFQEQTGWHPETVTIFAGALMYSRYGPLTKWIMERISSHYDEAAHDRSYDHEYTDWSAVATWADHVASEAAKGAGE